jgi:hypothetical protein
VPVEHSAQDAQNPVGDDWAITIGDCVEQPDHFTPTNIPDWAIANARVDQPFKNSLGLASTPLA